MRALLRLSTVLLCLAALTGCAMLYRSTAADNVTLQAQAESGAFLSGRGARLGIYRMGNGCPMEFLGWVDIASKPVHFGLPAGQKVYLLFAFPQSQTGRDMTRSSGVELTPRHGAQYLVKVNWVDGLFGARVWEVGEDGEMLHEFDHSNYPCPDADN